MKTTHNVTSQHHKIFNYKIIPHHKRITIVQHNIILIIIILYNHKPIYKYI